MAKRLLKEIVEDPRKEWVSDIPAWGLASHSVALLIDPPIFVWGGQILCIDVETDERDNFVGIGFCENGGIVKYFTHLGAEARLALERGRLIGHNIKADVQWLRKWGVNIKTEQMVFDTMLASYVQDSTRQSHSLKDLTKEVLGYEYPAYKEIVGKGKLRKTLDQQPVELVANYCGLDVLSTFRLYQYFAKVLSEAQKRYLTQVEMPCMASLLLMEERGVMVDAAYLRTLDYKFNVENQRLVQRVRRRAPSIVNINSDKQVGDFLVTQGFTLPKTETGKNSVSTKALEPFEGVPFIKALKRYSELEKLTSTYTGPLIERSDNQDTYRLHAYFNQAATYTGRLSSSGPNLQNIPTRTSTGNLVRKAFVPKPGMVLIDADYSQIEPRLFAHYSQDPELLQIFRKGLDLYDYVAASIGCTRQVAKIVWLALTYNAGGYKIAQTAHISVTQAYAFIDKMKRKFAKAFAFKERTILDASSDKYVDTLGGRRISVKEPGLAPNYLIQGSAAEIMKKAIIATSVYSPVLTVHDELLFEVPILDDLPIEASIKNIMEAVVSLTVPLVVETGTGFSWDEAKQ